MNQLSVQITTLTEMVEQKVQKREELTTRQKGFFERRESLSEQMNALDKEVFRLRNSQEKCRKRWILTRTICGSSMN